MPLDERVLVIPTATFREAGYFQGFRRADPDFVRAVLNPQNYQFLPRAEMETNAAFKQLIPYVVLRHEGSLYQYRRGKAGNEKRLQSLRSIGIGGHISEEDARGGSDPYRTGMFRELKEEVSISGEWTEQLVGFINDDRTPVGCVHLGVAHLVNLSSASVQAKEDALAEGGFAPVGQLEAIVEEFETWSQFMLNERLL